MSLSGLAQQIDSFPSVLASLQNSLGPLGQYTCSPCPPLTECQVSLRSEKKSHNFISLLCDWGGGWRGLGRGLQVWAVATSICLQTLCHLWPWGVVVVNISTSWDFDTLGFPQMWAGAAPSHPQPRFLYTMTASVAHSGPRAVHLRTFSSTCVSRPDVESGAASYKEGAGRRRQRTLVFLQCRGGRQVNGGLLWQLGPHGNLAPTRQYL